MSEKIFCYQCYHLKSIDLLTGEKMPFGRGCCHDSFGALYRHPKYLQEPPEDCNRFTPRTIKQIEKIEDWMNKHGITSYVRSMA